MNNYLAKQDNVVQGSHSELGLPVMIPMIQQNLNLVPKFLSLRILAFVNETKYLNGWPRFKFATDFFVFNPQEEQKPYKQKGKQSTDPVKVTQLWCNFFLPRHARCFENVRFDQCPIGHFKVKKKKPLCSKRGSKRLNFSFQPRRKANVG